MGLIAVPGFNHNSIGFQQRRRFGTANPLGQFALDPIQNLACCHASGKLKTRDAIPTGAFYQVSDIKIKTFVWGAGSIHLMPLISFTALLGCPRLKMTNGGSIADFQCLGNSVKDQMSTIVSNKALQHVDITVLLRLGRGVNGLDAENRLLYCSK